MPGGPAPTQSASHAHYSGTYYGNRSMTPPAQPLSKRDKRRGAIQERVHEFTESFGNTRDYHFRQQVQSLQNEMALISNSELHGMAPLSDSPEDIFKFIDELATNGQIVPEAIPSGRWYSKFVQEVNQTKEERDAELAILMVC